MTNPVSTIEWLVGANSAEEGGPMGSVGHSATR